MASQPINPGQGGAPPGGGGAPSPGAAGGNTQNPLQIIAAMTRLAQMLAQAAPSTSQETEQIVQSIQSAARKLVPQQPQQKPPAGY